MAKLKPGALAEVLLQDFVAPLVLGGEMKPGRPIGGALALALSDDAEHLSVDGEKLSLVQLARIRAARKLVPIDRIEGMTGPEWALAAVLHDIVQSAHPDLSGVFRSSAPSKVLAICQATLDRIPPPRSIREALERHTLFSRIFEITRTDTKVSWWVGSATFLGADPPGRLTAWPEVRRVHIDKTPRTLLDLPGAGGHAPAEGFNGAIGLFLQRTPLTDFTTCIRAGPDFKFTAEALSLVGARAGRTLVLRTLSSLAEEATDVALGRAIRAMLVPPPKPELSGALALVGERMLLAAQRALSGTERAIRAHTSPEAAMAQSIGARAAAQIIAMEGEGLRAEERTGILAILRPLAQIPLTEPANAILAAFA
jgi:hypothetical protein